jgi:hypothetical protein
MLCPCGEFNSNIAFVQECASPFGKVVKKKIYLLKAKKTQPVSSVGMCPSALLCQWTYNVVKMVLLLAY